MKKMKKIDKSFKSQQEIFAWLGSGGKVVYKASGNIISFIDGKLVSETSNVEVTRDFNVSKDWEKVLPLLGKTFWKNMIFLHIFLITKTS